MPKQPCGDHMTVRDLLIKIKVLSEEEPAILDSEIVWWANDPTDSNTGDWQGDGWNGDGWNGCLENLDMHVSDNCSHLYINLKLLSS